MTKAVSIPLTDIVQLRAASVRSANLELADPTLLDSYVPTGRTLDVLDRWTRAMGGHARTRAFSVTGPYGSGKSSLALFLAALVAPSHSKDRELAENALHRTDQELFERLARARDVLGGRDHGFVRALATAERGPLVGSLARALLRGLDGMRPFDSAVGRHVDRLRAVILDPGAPDAAARFLGCLEETASSHPVLLIIDELGQALQFAAEERRLGDFFLLQQVAERATGDVARPVFFFTLQHLSFGDYLGAIGEVERREWGKVQGRFEDVPFLESHDQTIGLIERTLQPVLNARGTDSVQRWADKAWAVLESLGLESFFPEGRKTVAAVYPLHPVTLLVLPQLCAAYAQHERTLFSFLASGEPGSVADFIRTGSAGEALPFVGLDTAYDYFIHSVRSSSGSSAASRWLEIDRRIRETYGLSATDVGLLKSVAILNLVSQGGALRASKPVLAFALTSPDREPPINEVGERLTALGELGILTYRSFADEYRLWRGSDFDLARAVADERAILEGESRAAVVSLAVELEPITAVRHTQLSGTYRFFDARFVDGVTRIELRPGASGIVAYWIGEGDSETVTWPAPAVVVRARDESPLIEASMEAAALYRILTERRDHELDWVARQELAERLSEAQVRARLAFAAVFDLEDPGVTLLHADGEAVSRSPRISRVISDLCDRLYSAAPQIRSEMLSRDAMTSQAARGRRDLLEALTVGQAEPHFGISGFGPDRAMYEAVFAFGRLHISHGDSWILVAPEPGSTFYPAWSQLEMSVRSGPEWPSIADIEAALVRPPFGLPGAVIPILIAAFLEFHSDDLGIFQDGTYQPVLSADVLERIVKIPDRFQVRDFRASEDRVNVFLETTRRHLGIAGSGIRSKRNLSILSVAAPLLATIRGLPQYTLATKRLSRPALEVRDRLIDARQPDELLFTELPSACGLPPLADVTDPIVAEDFGRRLAVALRELRGAYRQLLMRVADGLVNAFDSPPGQEIRQDLRERATVLRERELEAHLQATADAFASDSLEDDEWLTTVGLAVSGRPPGTWSDGDEDRFHIELVRIARMFKDAEALAFAAGTGRKSGAKLVTVTSSNGEQISRVLSPHEAPDAEDLKHALAALHGDRVADEHAIRVALGMLEALIVRRANDESLEGDQR